jgi:hypothetical protein
MTNRLLAVALASALAFAACGDDDGGPDSAAGTTTSVADTAATTTETTATTATAVGSAAAVAVFPLVSDDTRFDDPVAAAEAFAARYVGYTDPVMSEFRQGDSRSGEVGTRPTADGPETIVLVRQLEDDTWWVLGSVAPGIELTSPTGGAFIGSPLTVSGRGVAYEGNIEVDLWADGQEEPLASTFVTGGATEMAPFETTIEFPTPRQYNGTLLLRSRSAEDGGVWEASVVRVAF